MRRGILIAGMRESALSLLRDDRGASLVEFAIVLPLFLLIFFALIDFGLLGYRMVAADKAAQMAGRIAAVRLPACGAGTPFPPYARAAGSTSKFGTYCRKGGVCAAPNIDPTLLECNGAAGNPTVDEIMTRVQVLLPGATAADLHFKYDYDPNLGFLGGPFVPRVTTTIHGLTYKFVSPLGALINLAARTSGLTLGDHIPLPSMSVSFPGEDLAEGEN